MLLCHWPSRDVCDWSRVIVKGGNRVRVRVSLPCARLRKAATFRGNPKYWRVVGELVMFYSVKVRAGVRVCPVLRPFQFSVEIYHILQGSGGAGRGRGLEIAFVSAAMAKKRSRGGYWGFAALE